VIDRHNAIEPVSDTARPVSGLRDLTDSFASPPK